VGLVECPHCGPTKVAKRLMAPAIPKKGRPARNAKPEAPTAPKPACGSARWSAPCPPRRRLGCHAGGTPRHAAALADGN
jgi:hypothetical protein